MNAIKAKSYKTQTLVALVLGFAPLAIAGCSGTDDPGTPDLTCGGLAGKNCPDKMFCDYEADNCGLHDALGKCQPVPTACKQDCTTVCGCDSKSYCNACVAHVAGVDEAAGMTCDDLPPMVR